ncbi:MAG: hypothetical protein ACI8YQ_004902 [Polaribacter sp.]|jgi:hypothetical protein
MIIPILKSYKNTSFFFALKAIVFILIMVLISSCTTKTTKARFKLPPALKEVSGLYLQNPQSFWWLNDGGHPSTLYKTNGRGQVTDSLHFPSIRNRDWEDLTTDDKGNIYIGDFGNNNNKRQDLRIYIYNQESQQLDSILFSYSDQKQFPPSRAHWNFDMEAFLWHNEKLHLFSKNRVGQGNYYCKHYTLMDKAGEQNAILKDSIYLKDRVVTAAAISPDKKTVALLAYDYKRIFGFFPFSKASIFYFTDFEGDDFFKGSLRKRRAPSFIIATQFESLDFLDDGKLYIASEQTVFIKPKAKRVRVRK